MTYQEAKAKAEAIYNQLFVAVQQNQSAVAIDLLAHTFGADEPAIPTEQPGDNPPPPAEPPIPADNPPPQG